MFQLLIWLAEWRDDQSTLLARLAETETRLALEAELTELGERLRKEETALQAHVGSPAELE